MRLTLASRGPPPRIHLRPQRGLQEEEEEVGGGRRGTRWGGTGTGGGTDGRVCPDARGPPVVVTDERGGSGGHSVAFHQMKLQQAQRETLKPAWQCLAAGE